MAALARRGLLNDRDATHASVGWADLDTFAQALREGAWSNGTYGCLRPGTVVQYVASAVDLPGTARITVGGNRRQRKPAPFQAARRTDARETASIPLQSLINLARISMGTASAAFSGSKARTAFTRSETSGCLLLAIRAPKRTVAFPPNSVTVRAPGSLFEQTLHRYG
ncbi:hypothetical protein NS226_17880 [Aureimonas ureilytica]|uniref:Uncharacterized protein n=1 Tax=Aureimonas ureilytica TaxID=401562 RepID=A0A175R4J5_9HYPH|nr:hypothetical protein NS226_17880 [Aureimonas ureilytica]